MNEDFEASKVTEHGEVKVFVTVFNGMMAVCGDDKGAVLITKEQAMKFFDLKESKENENNNQ